MKITLNDDPTPSKPLPNRPFVARHRSLDGPLCIVTEHVGHGEKRFGCIFLEGKGAPAIWDEWCAMPIEKIAKEFLPLNVSITLTNTWPGSQ